VELQETAHRTSGYAIASLVIGIVGLTTLTFVPSIIAVILGIKARREIRDGIAAGEGLATAGIFLGWVGVALPAAGILFFLLWLGLL
jgi:hypothetical protein